MKALACVALLTTAGLAQADPTTDLRKLCAEQERQIVALEKRIETLHSELALERRRARGTTPEAAPSAVASAPSAGSYVVCNGDTLSSIARQYKTTSSALMKDNGITDPTRLRVGQTIKIPGGVEPAKEVAKAPAPAPVVAKAPVETKAPAEAKAPVSPTYKVQSGDTFYKIARTHALTVAKLETLNPGIDPARIVIGQELAVSGTPRKAPALAESGTRTITTKAPEAQAPPTVKKEAPKSPAPKAEARKEEAKPAPAPEAKPAPKTISSIIVMEEISFEKFAGKHGTSTEQLNALNGLTLKDSTVLAKGSELYVPGR